jgi:hypothetical protein
MKTEINQTHTFNTTKNPWIEKNKPKLEETAEKNPDKLKKENSPDYKLDLKSALPTPTPPVPNLPQMPSIKMSEEKKSETKKVDKGEDLKELKKVAINKEKKHFLKKDQVIFIKGLDLFSSPLKSEAGYEGINKLADAFEGSKIFKWNEQDDILNEINKIHPSNKIILVGHSLGGDTAVEISRRVDSLDHKFRPIDLLVTIDAVGFNNDIIPQNVKNHLNVFGESNFLLNDGPHVARNHEKTQVKNVLSHKDHTEIDDDKSIQFEVVNLIQQTLSEKIIS